MSAKEPRTGLELIHGSGLGRQDGAQALLRLVEKGRLIPKALPADQETRLRRLCQAVSLAMDALDEAGFGYLKIDYNETLGIGVDHPDSLGEGLRQNVQGWYDFLGRLKRQIPDLVVENCSSGGHRLEPSLMARCEMASFSDAHETSNVPILAAQLQRLILPRQSQIWAVLHAADSEDRLVYILAATFYGRMCISGEVFDLSAAQMETVRRSMDFYLKAAATIKHGRSTLRDSGIANRRHTQGWQYVLRVRDAEGSDLACPPRRPRSDSQRFSRVI
jgi:alpha-galactosidase